MRKIILLLASFFLSGYSYGFEFRGEAGLDALFFVDDSDYVAYNHSLSLYLRPEWFYETQDRKQLVTLIPWLRKDQRDDRRTRADIREFSWIYVADNWEVRTGINRVSWRVTEGRHLVDVINQTDLADDQSGDQRLGQPMLNVSTIQDWGILDIYVLPGFRERTFAGPNGRPGLPVRVSREAVYESHAEKRRVDAALRWQYFSGGLRLALSHFSGNGREPLLLPDLDAAFAAGWQGAGPLPDAVKPVLIPNYSVVDRSGLELQYVRSGWSFKLEAVSQSGQGRRYSAADAGFEYTQTGLFGTWLDLGWIMEYLWEDREALLQSAFANDVLIGHRLTFNDMASTELLWGIIADLDNQDSIATLEFSRRIGGRWRLALEGEYYHISDDQPGAQLLYELAAQRKRPDPLSFSASDTSIKISLAAFF